MKKRVLAVLLVLALLISFVPAQPQAASITYYGRTAIKSLNNGSNLQKAYDAIVKGVEASSSQITLRQYDLSFEELEIVVDAYRRDHTEHFWFYSFSADMAGQKVYYMNPQYTMGGNQLTAARAAMEASIQQILSGLDDSMSEYEKELYLHDTLAERVVYAESNHAHDAYGALVEGVAVCEGYAEALQVLLHRAGIRSFIALGSDRDTGIPHAWNYVRIDGKWYHTDLTWDDPNETIYHAYLNMSGSMISEDHIIDPCSYALPSCTSTTAHYFTVNKAKFSASTYTVEGIADLLKKTPWTATLYITDDVNAFFSWYQNNISLIVSLAGAQDIGSYGATALGREVHIYLKCRHSSLTAHPATTGTCSTPGHKLYYSCDGCGTLFDADRTTVLREILYTYADHFYVDGYCINCQVFTAGGKFYATLEEAAASGSDYVQLNMDATTDVCLDRTIYLDLNGKYFNGDLTIAEGETLYLFDTATAEYDATYRGGITGTVTGEIAPNCNTPAGYGKNYKYLTLVEQDGTISAHRYYLALRTAYLNPYQQSADYYGSAINYRTVLRCSDFVAYYIRQWGTKLTGTETVYAEAATAKAGYNSSKTALVGTIRDNNSEEQNIHNAEQQVLAEGYIRLEDGTELTSAGVSQSLHEIVMSVRHMTLTEGQKAAMREMCRIFPDLMERWGLTPEDFQ